MNRELKILFWLIAIVLGLYGLALVEVMKEVRRLEQQPHVMFLPMKPKTSLLVHFP